MYMMMSTAAKSRDDSMPNGANVLLSPSNTAQPSSLGSSGASTPSGQSQPTHLMPDDIQAVLRGTFTHKCQIPQKLRQIRLFLWSTQTGTFLSYAKHVRLAHVISPFQISRKNESASGSRSYRSCNNIAYNTERIYSYSTRTRAPISTLCISLSY